MFVGFFGLLDFGLLLLLVLLLICLVVFVGVDFGFLRLLLVGLGVLALDGCFSRFECFLDLWLIDLLGCFLF